MWKRSLYLASAALVAWSLASGDAFAGPKKGGVKVGGNVTQNTAVLGNTNTLALGKDVKAGTGIGTINNANVKGNVTQNTAVLGNTNTLALGKGVEACTTIGGIGDNPACE